MPLPLAPVPVHDVPTRRWKVRGTRGTAAVVERVVEAASLAEAVRKAGQGRHRLQVRDCVLIDESPSRPTSAAGAAS